MPSFIKDSHSKWKYCGFADIQIHIFPVLYISPLVMFRLPDSIFLHFKEKSISSDMNRKPNLVTEEVQKHITIVQVN